MNLSLEATYAPAAVAFASFETAVSRLTDRPDVRRVCELGAGANPLLALEHLQASELDYLLIDRSATELQKRPPGYQAMLADILEGVLGGVGPQDLVFSRALLEHVQHPARAHRNIFGLLRPGGLAVHFFPTLYWPPFVLNRLLPEPISARLLHWLQPGREPEGGHAKFPALYRWCRGPTPRQVRRLESVGFEVIEYHAFFGQPDYVRRIPVLARLDRWLTEWLVRRPVPALTSYAFVVLRRP